MLSNKVQTVNALVACKVRIREEIMKFPVGELVQEEIDNREGLLQYMKDYHEPRGVEILSIEEVYQTAK